jgi:predicted nucleic acid-binding protein
MNWLLDTNVVSELKKRRPEPRVTDFLLSCATADLYVSVITLAEIRFGIEIDPDATRRRDLEAWLSGVIRPMFEGRVVNIDEDVFLRWRLFVEQGRKRGRTYSEPDLMLAAAASERGMTLVTRNVKGFVGLPVAILNPWNAVE